MALLSLASRRHFHYPLPLQAFAPTEAVRFEEEEIRSADWYLSHKAKPIKREADAKQSDRIKRQLLYMESIVYFLLAVRAMEKETASSSSRPASMLAETKELLYQVTKRFSAHASTTSSSLYNRIMALSLQTQAILSFRLYAAHRAEVRLFPGSEVPLPWSTSEVATGLGTTLFLLREAGSLDCWHCKVRITTKKGLSPFLVSPPLSKELTPLLVYLQFVSWSWYCNVRIHS